MKNIENSAQTEKSNKYDRNEKINQVPIDEIK
jgi:hypothetical protein